MIQYLIIGILFVMAVAWIVIRSVKSLSTKTGSCNKSCGCITPTEQTTTVPK